MTDKMLQELTATVTAHDPSIEPWQATNNYFAPRPDLDTLWTIEVLNDLAKQVREEIEWEEVYSVHFADLPNRQTLTVFRANLEFGSYTVTTKKGNQ